MLEGEGVSDGETRAIAQGFIKREQHNTSLWMYTASEVADRDPSMHVGLCQMGLGREETERNEEKRLQHTSCSSFPECG